MHLSALHLRNFRCYDEALFEFSPKINVIRGPNARGKTSLLEAIYFMITGRSFRTSQLSDLIRQGTTFFSLEACFTKHGIEQKLRIHYNGKERRVTYNSTPCTSSLHLLGLLQGAVIHPDDAAVVKGSPANRRHLLDLQLAQADPLYVHHLTRYEKAMRQRNHLLRAKKSLTIESWEYEMAHAAAYVIQQRAKVVKDLEEQATAIYQLICAGAEKLGLTYKAHGTGETIPTDIDAMRTLFREQYQRHRPKEMDLGLTLTGPHKDDMQISLGNKDARDFASEGQQRSCVVALRLAEWQLLRGDSHEQPLMLVDDLGISLDASRRSHLLEHMQSLGQVFFTTTDAYPLMEQHHHISI